MENVKNLKDTINTFVDCVKKIDGVTVMKDLAPIERKAVRALQLAEIQISEAGDDLYNAVRKKRRELSVGKVVIPEPKKKKNAK